MEYHVKASSICNNDAIVQVKQSEIAFGTTQKTAHALPNPAELFLSALAACVLKNVERFSGMMKITYAKANVEVRGTRLENPPRMDNIVYRLAIFSNDTKINIPLLKKNIEKFGTIFNTVKLSSSVSGTPERIGNV